MIDILGFKLGDIVRVRYLHDGSRRDVMYGGYDGEITAFRGEDGPDAQAFVESIGFQTVAFRQWFPLAELDLLAANREGAGE